MEEAGSVELVRMADELVDQLAALIVAIANLRDQDEPLELEENLREVREYLHEED